MERIVEEQHQRERYDRIWAPAVERLRRGAVEVDPVLASKTADRRRGLTLIIRPPKAVVERVGGFLDTLHELEPDQHYYSPDEMHVTLLALFGPTEEHRHLFERSGQYAAAAALALESLPPFSLRYTGLTASSNAIMVQGYSEHDFLNQIRNRLRTVLHGLDLGQELDKRYRIETAHMTVARFRNVLRSGKRLAELLQKQRRLDFGTTVVESLELVVNDWYMTPRSVRPIRSYKLTGPA